MRVFPATLSFDDPGVANEAAVGFGRVRAPGAVQKDLSVDYSKTLTRRFGLSVGGDYQWQTPDAGPAVRGWDNLALAAQYQLFVNGPHEAIGLVGLGASVGGTGSASIAEGYSTISPEFAFGKGMGDLPWGLRYLRPLAVTGAVSGDFPIAGAGASAQPNVLNWAFSLQYSLPYLQDFVKYVGLKAPFANMVPVVEFPMQTVSGRTTGYMNPGVIWLGHYYQIGLEAQIPVSADSGSGVGFVFGVNLYLDDLLPHSLGRALWN
ncbi:MAG TPA: hypothetical protein PLO69_01545 [Gammaproteobacteria bacterium]|nr:hypothetical protein [Gammaproteobacteria bacterium]